jgi:hypothetical protein
MKITRKRFFKILESDKKQTKKMTIQNLNPKQKQHVLSKKRAIIYVNNHHKDTLKTF